MARGRWVTIGVVIYLAIGLIIAAQRDYLRGGINTGGEWLSLVVAVLLWPLILFGVNLRF